MNILHFADINNRGLSGVCTVVPEHIKNQSKFANCKLVNIQNTHINGIEEQYYLSDDFDYHILDDIDLVIFHENYCFKYIKIGKILRKRKIPYIIVPHGELNINAQHKKLLKKKLANILLWNKFIYGALAIQCLSQNEFDNTKFKTQKIICTNGIKLQDKIKSQFNKNKISFVFIGRLEIKNKGLDLLIEVIRKNKDILKKHNCEFLIFGPDYHNRYTEVENLIKENNVQDIVILNHEVIGEEKEQRLLDADIFIQTSRYEGMPMGLLEAMSYGLPVLITEGTSLGDFVNKYDAGWVCKTNADDLSKTLLDCIDKKEEYLRKGKNGIRLVSENFEWNNVAKQAIDKYQELINK